MADASPAVPARFEEAMAELDDIVRKLESGQLSLEDAITAYERGTQLRQHCQTILESARLRVEKITAAADGSVTSDDMPLT